MKTLKILPLILLTLLISSVVNGQGAGKEKVKGTKTEKFSVNGACGMCKTRIENGLKMDGITKAEWDKTTKTASVTFDPSKVTVDDMKKKVASLGHDTDKFKAPDDVYAKLPGCCHYDRTK